MKAKKIISSTLALMMIFSSFISSMNIVKAESGSEISSDKTEIKIGESTSLSFNPILPEDAVSIDYVWSCDNQDIVLVTGENNTATVEGITTGKAKITAVVNYHSKTGLFESQTETNETVFNQQLSADIEITVTENENSSDSVETDVKEKAKSENKDIVKATEESELNSEDSNFDEETVEYITSNMDNKYISNDLILSNALIIKNTLVDADKYVKGDTIDSIMISDKADDMFIATLKSSIALYTNDNSDYYVGFANTMQDDDNVSVNDYIFAMNNENGEVLTDCYFDKATGLAYIPKSHFMGNENQIIAGNVQLQLLQVVGQNSSKIKSEVEFNTVNDDEIKTGDKSIDAFDFETKVQTEKGLSQHELTVSVNGVPVTSEGYTYNSETGVVTLPVSSASVQSVTVDVNKDSLATEFVNSILNISDVSAVNMNTMGCAGTVDLPAGAQVGSSYDVTLYNAYASIWGPPSMDAYGYYNEQELVNLTAYGGSIDWSKVTQQTQSMYLGIYLPGGWGSGPGGVDQVLPNLWNWSADGATGNVEGWLRLQCTHVSNPLGNDSNVDWGFAPVRFRVLALTSDEVVVSILSRRVNTQSGSSIVKFKIRKHNGNLNIQKQSALPSLTDGNACYSLEGAEYQLRDSSNNVVATLVTDKDGKASANDIPSGTYSLYETKASPGFEISSGSTSVTINAGQTTTLNGTGVLSEMPANDPVAIQITKADADSGESVAQGNASLEGAQFTVKYYNGLYDSVEELPSTATRTWVIQTKALTVNNKTYYMARLGESYLVSGDDFYTLDGQVTLPIGTITIQETKAPEGYLLDNAILSDNQGNTENVDDGIFLTKITQDVNGGSASVVAGNFPVVKDIVKKQKIKIEKLAKNTDGTSSPLNGSIFTIKLKDDVKSNGWENAVTYDEITTSTVEGENGVAVSKELPYGTYILRETFTPDGYVKADDIEFTIDKDQTEVETIHKFVITDEENHIQLYKYDMDTGKELRNAEFLVYNVTKNEELGRYKTNDKGLIDLYRLQNNCTYYVQEITAPNGYLVDDTKYYFTISKDGFVSISDENGEDVNRNVFTINDNGDMKISIPNQLKYFKLNITKINDNDLTLEGAEFTIYKDKECTQSIRTGTTDKNGVLLFESLDVGTYYLKETKAPNGYRLIEEPIKVAFGCVDKEYVFYINDIPVDSDDENYSLEMENDWYIANMTIVNNRLSLLPATGSKMTLFIIGSGSVLCLFILYRKVKKGNHMNTKKMKKIAISLLISATSFSGVSALTTSVTGHTQLITPVEAASQGKITIYPNVSVTGETQSLSGKKFNIYRIFDAENADNMESINYTMNKAYENSLKKVTGKSTEYEIIDYIQSLNNNVIVNDVSGTQEDESRYSEFRYFVENLRNQIVEDNAEPTQVITIPDIDNDSYTLDVPYGWYIIDEITDVNGKHSAASLCMVNTANPNVSFYMKSDYPTIQKQILEDDNQSTIGNENDGWNDVGDYEIGQTVPYRYLTYVPNINGYESYYFAMHDKMDQELTFNKNSVNVTLDGKKLTNGTDYKIVTDNLPDGETFQIQFPDLKATVTKYCYPEQVDKNPETEKIYGQKIVVEYNATLNDLAQNDTGRPGFENDVKLEYSNNPDSDGNGQTGETPWDTVVAFTFRMNSIKVNDQEEERKLEGAKFRLYSDAECTQEVYVKQGNDGYVVINRDSVSNGEVPVNAVEMVSDEDGIFNIIGLDSQTYYLKETKAPAGYRLLKDAIKIDVKATYGDENRTNYIKGDGATNKTLQKLEASAHFKEFYSGKYSEYDNNLTTDVENGTLNIKVVNKVGSKLPATGSAISIVLVGIGSAMMIAVLIKRKKDAKE